MTGQGADTRAWMRAAMIAVYGFIGVVHLAATDRFLPIMPDFVPQPRLVVVLTGLAEIAGALALMTPRLRRAAGIGFALYAVCVFPANLKHAFAPIVLPPIPDSWWYHGPRLAAQPAMVWWALYATHLIDWPFGGRRRSEDAGIPGSQDPGIPGGTPGGLFAEVGTGSARKSAAEQKPRGVIRSNGVGHGSK